MNLKKTVFHVSTLCLALLLCTSCIHEKFLQYIEKQQAEYNSSSPLKSAKAIQEFRAGSYLTPVPAHTLWDKLLDILVQNYNITIANKSSGIITTEWDSYYLGKKIYRNKISVRIKSLENQKSLLTIRNNVENLLKTTAQTYQPVWLPSEDKTDEVKRLVKNLSLLLNLPNHQKLPPTRTAEANPKVLPF